MTAKLDEAEGLPIDRALDDWFTSPEQRAAIDRWLAVGWALRGQYVNWRLLGGHKHPEEFQPPRFRIPVDLDDTFEDCAAALAQRANAMSDALAAGSYQLLCGAPPADGGARSIWPDGGWNRNLKLATTWDARPIPGKVYDGKSQTMVHAGAGTLTQHAWNAVCSLDGRTWDGGITCSVLARVGMTKIREGAPLPPHPWLIRKTPRANRKTKTRQPTAPSKKDRGGQNSPFDQQEFNSEYHRLREAEPLLNSRDVTSRMQRWAIKHFKDGSAGVPKKPTVRGWCAGLRALDTSA